MPEDKNLDFNEEDTSAGDGQPEDKNNTSAPSDEELDDAIDNILKEGDDDDGDDEEETVIVSKKEYEKTERDRDNYKKGLLSLKEKGKKKTEKKEVKQVDEPLSKKEFQKANENQAIRIACKDSDIEENWNKIVKFYTPRHGKNDVEGIVEDINDAHTLFQKKNEDKEDDEDKKSTADLASDKNLQAGDTSKKKNSKLERKSVIPKKETAQDWYLEKDK